MMILNLWSVLLASWLTSTRCLLKLLCWHYQVNSKFLVAPSPNLALTFPSLWCTLRDSTAQRSTAQHGAKETACKASLTETMIVAKHNMTIEPWILAAEIVIFKSIILTAVRNSVTGFIVSIGGPLWSMIYIHKSFQTGVWLTWIWSVHSTK